MSLGWSTNLRSATIPGWVLVGAATIAGLLQLALVSVPQVRAQSPQTAVVQSPATADAQSPPSAVPTTASFEVASIKPNHSGDRRFFVSWQPGRFNATGMTLKFLITMAYDVKDFQVSGGPGWVNAERYDIDAKEPDAIAQELEKLPREQRSTLADSMLQSLLADRFQLKLTRGTKELPAYALVVAKNGPKLQEAKPVDTPTDAPSAPGGHPHGPMMRMGRGELNGQGVGLGFLASVLSQQLGRQVLDQTGLKGNYDLALKWTPDQGEGMMMGGPPPGGGPPPDGAPPPDASGPSIFTALQEQLGLRLEATKAPADVLTIDHVEKPSEN
ncbi:MAG: TIGR03435 family protein [Terriglobia bacterium]